ncbi:MAG: S8 family serine peptidase, partial [Lachnospiraceae bacterium]
TIISAINQEILSDGAVSTYSRRASYGVEVINQWSIVTNAFAIRIPYGKLDAIKKLDGVKRAYVQHVYSLPEDSVVVEGKPTYSYSYDLVGIEGAWNEGYTGKGMLVAVLDSGIDIKTDWNGIVVRTHEAFTEDSFMSKSDDGTFDWELRYDAESMKDFLAETDLASNVGSSGNHITYDNNALYKNLKVPYAADYADGDVNVCPTDSDHGTHVSGTIAGYVKTEEGEVKFSGIAPDAQILMMKVFPDADGGAEEISIISALEDSLKLGADMINLSLGSDNGYAVDDTAQNDTYARIEAAGIVLMTSAGNSAYSTTGNNYGGDNLSSNPDISMISCPAVYDSNLSVASSDSVVDVQAYFTWTDAEGTEHKVAYSDPYSVAMKSTFKEGEYSLVNVDGVGTWSDYYSVGFDTGYNGGTKTGIALVKRGEISFTEKVNNASSFTGWNYRTGEKIGCLGVIIYDNDPNGTDLINMSVENVSMTSAFISGKDGAEIVAALNAGYDVKIKVSQEDMVVDFATAGEMSTFSSWGAGPGLELKPEITAPGGNIWSSVLDTSNTGNDGYTGSYSMMSGTSMAAPHMTGISALVRQYIGENGNKFGVSDKEMGDLISQLLVSTAVPIKDKNGVYYSPRQQGAGLVNATAAVKTPAYLSMEGQNVAKLELLDDPEKTGIYDITFDINNVSNNKVHTM